MIRTYINTTYGKIILYRRLFKAYSITYSIAGRNFNMTVAVPKCSISLRGMLVYFIFFFVEPIVKLVEYLLLDIACPIFIKARDFK